MLKHPSVSEAYEQRAAITLCIKSDISLGKEAMVRMASKAIHNVLQDWDPDNERQIQCSKMWVEALGSNPDSFFQALPFPALAAMCGIIGSVICETPEDLWVITKLIEPQSASNTYVKLVVNGTHFSVILNDILQKERFLSLARSAVQTLTPEEEKMIERLRAKGMRVEREVSDSDSDFSMRDTDTEPETSPRLPPNVRLDRRRQ